MKIATVINNRGRRGGGRVLDVTTSRGLEREREREREREGERVYPIYVHFPDIQTPILQKNGVHTVRPITKSIQ